MLARLRSRWIANMEVTRKNFRDVFSTLSDVFSRAQFLAFDTEFTGLRIEGATGNNYFDTLEDLYLKDRLKAEAFMAIQFGIVAFFYDRETNKYSHEAYNFYIYPSSYSDVNFTCQSKSIEFLVQNGFDFNKVFGNGIPYLKDSEIDKLLEKLDERQERVQNSETMAQTDVPSENMAIVDTLLNNIDEIIREKNKLTFVTEKYNSFIRRLIYCAVKKKYGSSVFMVTNKDETMSVSVGYCEDEIKQKKMENYMNEKNKILDESGFCKVVKLIMESKKLIIGHNLLIDILFTIRQFLTPLPESYSEFKELTNFLFPNILDTKYMASMPEFRGLKDTSLSVVLDHFLSLDQIPKVDIATNRMGYELDDKKFHEAAYDAYITGLIFMAMSKTLGNLNTFENLTSSSFLKPILNKLAVRRMHDISHMNIGGIDPEPDRTGVYHLTFPKEWKRENISDLFQNCGFINVSWINNTSAFIKVKYEFIKEVETKLMNSNPNYKLISYKEYFKSNHGKDDETLASPVVQRKSVIERIVTNSNPPSGMGDANKKRQLEDIGEVIERPAKKQLT